MALQAVTSQLDLYVAMQLFCLHGRPHGALCLLWIRPEPRADQTSVWDSGHLCACCFVPLLTTPGLCMQFFLEAPKWQNSPIMIPTPMRVFAWKPWDGDPTPRMELWLTCLNKAWALFWKRQRNCLKGCHPYTCAASVWHVLSSSRAQLKYLISTCLPMRWNVLCIWLWTHIPICPSTYLPISLPDHPIRGGRRHQGASPFIYYIYMVWIVHLQKICWSERENRHLNPAFAKSKMMGVVFHC